MVAEVSSLVRIMSCGRCKEEKEEGDGSNESSADGGGGGKSAVLITQDLLAGFCGFGSDELDLDLHPVPSGWEKRLDLKSGKIYLQKCNSSKTLSSSEQKTPTVPKLLDLTSASESKTTLNKFDKSSLDLKLVSSSAPPSSSLSLSNYQSVCTLDKVKDALKRAERETSKKRPVSSLPPSNSSCSTEGRETVLDEKSPSSSSSLAAGCPSCLLYVLVSISSPKCPRCGMIVASPMSIKKPRIDLNRLIQMDT